MIERLSQLAPGVELAVALASIDCATVSVPDRLSVMRARARQIAHDQALLLADMVAVAEFDDPDTPAELAEVAFDCAAAEIGAALTYTRRAAEGWLDLARDVVRRLPALHTALLDGRLDIPKARVICSELSLVEDDTTARAVVDRLLPDAAGLTTGQLGARLRKLLAVEDAQMTAKRQAAGIARRRVDAQMLLDGTMEICGTSLPADRAAAAAERLHALARAAKTAGDARSLDQLRADVFLGLLNGDYDGPAPGYRRGVLELTVPLETLIGLAETPGDLAGYGPVVADLARQIADQQDVTWRYSILDETGRLIQHGVTRRRPTTGDANLVRARDRRCVFPGCRAPAHRCDLDHRHRHTDGGPATPDNLQPLCRWHHRCRTKVAGGSAAPTTATTTGPAPPAIATSCDPSRSSRQHRADHHSPRVCVCYPASSATPASSRSTSDRSL